MRVSQPLLAKLSGQATLQADQGRVFWACLGIPTLKRGLAFDFSSSPVLICYCCWEDTVVVAARPALTPDDSEGAAVILGGALPAFISS